MQFSNLTALSSYLILSFERVKHEMFHPIFQSDAWQIRNYYIAFRSSNVDIQNFLLISRFHFIKLSNVEIIRAIRSNHCIISKSTWANLRFLDFSLLDAREALDPTSV